MPSRYFLRRRRIELQVFANPGIHQAGRCKSAQQSQAAREPAGGVSQCRMSRSGSFEHCVGYDARFFGRCHHFLHPPVDGRTNLAIRIELGVGLQEIRIERRLRVGGLDDLDPDALCA